MKGHLVVSRVRPGYWIFYNPSICECGKDRVQANPPYTYRDIEKGWYQVVSQGESNETCHACRFGVDGSCPLTLDLGKGTGCFYYPSDTSGNFMPFSSYSKTKPIVGMFPGKGKMWTEDQKKPLQRLMEKRIENSIF
jgi:hypothetical protein